jgi:hypothetical protein
LSSNPDKQFVLEFGILEQIGERDAFALFDSDFVPFCKRLEKPAAYSWPVIS